MGARKLFLLETYTDGWFGGGGVFLNGSLYGNMLWVVESFWVLLCNFFLSAVGSVRRCMFRIHHAGDDGSEEKEKSYHFYDLQPENGEAYASLKGVGNSEKDNRHSFNGDKGDSVLLDTSSSRDQFSFGSDISGFVEEAKALSFTVQELFVGSVDPTNLSACDFSEEGIISEEKVPDFEERESAECFGVENALEQGAETGDFSGNRIAVKADAISSENELVAGEEISGEGKAFLETSASKIDLEAVDVDSDDGLYMNREKFDSFTNAAVLEAHHKVDSCCDKGFQSGSFWPVDKEIVEEVEEKPNSEESYMWNEDLAEPEAPSSIEDRQDQSDNDDYNDGFIDMELQEAIFLVENSGGAEEKHRQQKPDGGGGGEAEYDNRNDMYSSWEHDEIIEQLKLELKAARTAGLPTILEESESENESDSSPAKMADDLMKPLKITDQKLQHKDRIMEIQKVYKSYAERMRKLDVLNYQTMHAIGLLHLKDPLKSNATHRPLPSPGIKPLLLQNLLPAKLRRNKIGPAAKSMEAFYEDLEMIYVGQVCLSWEILQWQYGKSRELLESDPYGSRQYNFVASEIQLFQVLLLRFIENEPFQGPRIENYVKNRCVVRSFLQVPALRDDGFTEKARVGEEDAVPIAALMEIIEESIRLFWDFVRLDEEVGDAIIHSGCKKSHSNLPDSTDIELLIAARNQLQKKERKLKDILRSRNCIVKRFQKHREQDDRMLLSVFARVEVRLISRVLNMAKVTRDQVLWCREKLDQIILVNRKIYVEPSFLPFPC